jgi:hypothetical protein
VLWSATHMREQDRYSGNSHGYGRCPLDLGLGGGR